MCVVGFNGRVTYVWRVLGGYTLRGGSDERERERWEKSGLSRFFSIYLQGEVYSSLVGLSIYDASPPPPLVGDACIACVCDVTTLLPPQWIRPHHAAHMYIYILHVYTHPSHPLSQARVTPFIPLPPSSPVIKRRWSAHSGRTGANGGRGAPGRDGISLRGNVWFVASA